MRKICSDNRAQLERIGVTSKTMRVSPGPPGSMVMDHEAHPSPPTMIGCRDIASFEPRRPKSIAGNGRRSDGYDRQAEGAENQEGPTDAITRSRWRASQDDRPHRSRSGTSPTKPSWSLACLVRRRLEPDLCVARCRD